MNQIMNIQIFLHQPDEGFTGSVVSYLHEHRKNKFCVCFLNKNTLNSLKIPLNQLMAYYEYLVCVNYELGNIKSISLSERRIVHLEDKNPLKFSVNGQEYFFPKEEVKFFGMNRVDYETMLEICMEAFEK